MNDKFDTDYIAEIQMAIGEGCFSLEQVDNVLWLETKAHQGTLTDEEKEQILHRRF